MSSINPLVINQPPNKYGDQNKPNLITKKLITMDSEFHDILFSIPLAVLYESDDKDNWIPAGIEGVLYCIHRRVAPFYRVFIFNRLSQKNFFLDITENLIVAMYKNFLYFSDKSSNSSRHSERFTPNKSLLSESTTKVYTIWCRDSDKTSELNDFLLKCVENLNDPTFNHKPILNINPIDAKSSATPVKASTKNIPQTYKRSIINEPKIENYERISYTPNPSSTMVTNKNAGIEIMRLLKEPPATTTLPISTPPASIETNSHADDFNLYTNTVGSPTHSSISPTHTFITGPHSPNLNAQSYISHTQSYTKNQTFSKPHLEQLSPPNTPDNSPYTYQKHSYTPFPNHFEPIIEDFIPAKNPNKIPVSHNFSSPSSNSNQKIVTESTLSNSTNQDPLILPPIDILSFEDRKLLEKPFKNSIAKNTETKKNNVGLNLTEPWKLLTDYNPKLNTNNQYLKPGKNDQIIITQDLLHQAVINITEKSEFKSFLTDMFWEELKNLSRNSRT